MNQLNVSPHVVIVGAGLAGLVAAAHAAEAGSRVTVLERAAHPGGRGRSPVLASTAVNLGGHGLYRSGPAAQILRELGVPVKGGSPPKHGQLLVDGELDALPFSPWSILRARILRGERMRYVRFLSAATRCEPARAGDASWLAWVSARSPGPGAAQLARVFARLTTYVDAPDTIPARIVLQQLQRAVDGVLYLDGGWQVLVDALVARCRAGGVELRTSANVERVRVEQGRAVGVAVDGCTIGANAVVLAVPPAVAARTVPASRALAEQAARAVPCRLSTLDVVCDRRPAPHAPYLTMGVDVPIHATMHSDVAEFGKGAVMHAHRYLPLGDGAPADRADVERFVDAAFGGWREHVAQARWLPRIAVMHDVPRIGHQRAGVDVDDVFGLALCGDHVGDDVLLDAALASATRAAHHAVESARRSHRVAP